MAIKPIIAGGREVCPRCMGDGELDAVVTYIQCPACEGTGRTLVVRYVDQNGNRCRIATRELSEWADRHPDADPRRKAAG